MNALSPLHVVHKSLAQKAGQPEVVLPPEETHFAYSVTFPNTQPVSRAQPPLNYDVILNWSADTRRLLLHILVDNHGLTFMPWGSMKDFFFEVSENVQPFLPVWEGGELTPGYPYGEAKKLLAPGFRASLVCPDSLDEKLLQEKYNLVFNCAVQALLLARPIFKRVRRTGNPPNVSERMHFLEREFGLFELYHVPPSARRICLPRGWYENLRGGVTQWIQ